MNILPLSQGQYGLVSLATYPISPLSVMDLSSEPTCTYLYGMKAPDGVSYLFEKLYHVLLRLSVVSLQTSIPVDQWAAVFSTVVSCHWWRRKGVIRVAWQIFVHRFESGPGHTRVRPGSDLGLFAICLIWSFSCCKSRIFNQPFLKGKNVLHIQLWHVRCCAWSRASLASFLWQHIQYPQWFLLIWAVHHHALASIVCESHFARYWIIQYSASCHVSSWDDSVVGCWGFSTNLFCEKKMYWILHSLMRFCCWSRASMGLFLLQHIPYPLCM